MNNLIAELESVFGNVYLVYAAIAVSIVVLALLLRRVFGGRPQEGEADVGQVDAAVSPQSERPAVEDAAPPAAGDGLAALAGLPPALAQRLADAGIATTTQLFEHGRDPEALHALAESLQLEDFVLRKWVAVADLVRLPGVSAELADALIRCGTRNSVALAGENPDRVQHKLAAYAEKSDRLAAAPTRSEVVDLIAAAGSLTEA